jgi:hypothetical protein
MKRLVLTENKKVVQRDAVELGGKPTAQTGEKIQEFFWQIRSTEEDEKPFNDLRNIRVLSATLVGKYQFGYSGHLRSDTLVSSMSARA